ncbi:hypothetical protein P4O66_000549 [Electrophorus voltai]|uniref:Cadherin domain-containing protein n=1 Tax=Electrophorus voltai TaxID=2609070 RepID=A0AAD9E0M6_9TELE|nr:hypothetical protein P4O66_000549 [Electrophorus voltai]
MTTPVHAIPAWKAGSGPLPAPKSTCLTTKCLDHEAQRSSITHRERPRRLRHDAWKEMWVSGPGSGQRDGFPPLIRVWVEPASPEKSFMTFLFCLRPEQMRRSQGGRSSWWAARSSPMVCGLEEGHLGSTSAAFTPSSTESTSRNRAWAGGLQLNSGSSTHLGEAGDTVISFPAVTISCPREELEVSDIWTRNSSQYMRHSTQDPTSYGCGLPRMSGEGSTKYKINCPGLIPSFQLWGLVLGSGSVLGYLTVVQYWDIGQWFSTRTLGSGSVPGYWAVVQYWDTGSAAIEPLRLFVQLSAEALEHSSWRETRADISLDLLPGTEPHAPTKWLSDIRVISEMADFNGRFLSPLLYSLYTYDCAATTGATIIVKFPDNTVVMGLISDNDERAYLEEIKHLENWCQGNNLLLNVSKTKELIVDCSKKQEQHYQPVRINGTTVERVDSFRCLRDFRLPSKVLQNFHTCTIESILTENIKVWFGNSRTDKHSRRSKVKVGPPVEVENDRAKILWDIQIQTDKTFSSSSQVRQEFQVLEEQPIGTYVGTIETRASFTYRFSENHKLFAINGTTGVIYTSSVIDRETLPSNIINVVVLSSQPMYPTEVRIVVLDINDNSPVFPDASIVVSFKEDAARGRQVILDTATDADIGSNGVDHTTYRIVNGNERRKFRLDITVNPSGEGAFLHLVTTGGLDRELTPFYQLLIEVEDKGDPKKYGYLQVNVTIQDINDNAPVFDLDQYQSSVFEDAVVGTSVLQITATDQDEGTNADVRYFLDEGTPFQIDPKAGTIAIKEALDYESKKEYSLTIHAVDNGVPSLSGRTEAIIKLLDVNDNDPVVKFRYFPTTSKFASVDENAQIGTVVALLTVSDADSSAANGNISVSILGGNEQGHFEVHTSPVPNLSLIKVASVLDRERISSYNLTVSVSDNGKPIARSSFASLVIFVNDINDHPPIFQEAEYKVDISEDVPRGSYVKGVLATDGDSGQNANLRYSLVSGNSLGWFAISENSGLVTSAAVLDRETASVIVLNISAKDQGLQPKISYTKLISTYHVALVEHSPTGSELLLLSATDTDLGANGTLDAATGRLSAATELDREERGSYLLYVKATDSGSPPLHSVAKYFANIKENEPSGSYVTTVSASDPDLERNGMVREEKMAHQLQVSATDGGGLHSQAHAIVTVTVVDTQDNPPTFSQKEYSFVMFENVAPNSVIGTVSATTVDLNTNITEEQAFYQLKVIGRGGDVMGEALVNITVKDLNDNAPHFLHAVEHHGLITLTGPLEVTTSSYQIEIVASDLGVPQRSSTLLLTVEALDKDSGLNGEIVYDITDGNSNDVFGIFPDGQLYIKAELDREVQDSTNYLFRFEEERPRGSLVGWVFAEDRDAGPNSELDRESLMRQRGTAVFAFTVISSDQGLPKPLRDQAKVQVYIQDINDNAPKFSKDIYRASISESAQNMTQLLRVSASDMDESKNGLLHYHISEGNKENRFSIDSSSGQVTLVGKLDYETTINVLDENDNSPSFPKSTMTVDVLENMRIGELVASVTATDLDSGSNADITKLDYETQSLYKLNITAKDNGMPPRSSSIPLVIHVRDFNDNPPVFTPDADINGQLEYSIVQQTPRGSHFYIDPSSGDILTNNKIDREFSNMFELTVKASDLAVPNALVAEVNIVIGSILTTVVAFDPDEGANGEVEYELVKGDSDTFIMDSLTVSATDHGTERRTERTDLTIILRGPDGPVFSQAKYITILKEGQPAGTDVISLDASSPRGSAAKVEYFITATELDREQGEGLYLLDVYAIESEASQPRTQKAEIELSHNVDASLMLAPTWTLAWCWHQCGHQPGAGTRGKKRWKKESKRFSLFFPLIPLPFHSFAERLCSSPSARCSHQGDGLSAQVQRKEECTRNTADGHCRSPLSGAARQANISGQKRPSPLGECSLQRVDERTLRRAEECSLPSWLGSPAAGLLVAVEFLEPPDTPKPGQAGNGQSVAPLGLPKLRNVLEIVYQSFGASRVLPRFTPGCRSVSTAAVGPGLSVLLQQVQGPGLSVLLQQVQGPECTPTSLLKHGGLLVTLHLVWAGPDWERAEPDWERAEQDWKIVEPDWERAEPDWERAQPDWERAEQDWKIVEPDWERAEPDWERAQPDWERAEQDWKIVEPDWERAEPDWERAQPDWERAEQDWKIVEPDWERAEPDWERAEQDWKIVEPDWERAEPDWERAEPEWMVLGCMRLCSALISVSSAETSSILDFSTAEKPQSPRAVGAGLQLL